MPILHIEGFSSINDLHYKRSSCYGSNTVDGSRKCFSIPAVVSGGHVDYDESGYYTVTPDVIPTQTGQSVTYTLGFYFKGHFDIYDAWVTVPDFNAGPVYSWLSSGSYMLGYEASSVTYNPNQWNVFEMQTVVLFNENEKYEQSITLWVNGNSVSYNIPQMYVRPEIYGWSIVPALDFQSGPLIDDLYFGRSVQPLGAWEIRNLFPNQDVGTPTFSKTGTSGYYDHLRSTAVSPTKYAYASQPGKTLWVKFDISELINKQVLHAQLCFSAAKTGVGNPLKMKLKTRRDSDVRSVCNVSLPSSGFYQGYQRSRDEYRDAEWNRATIAATDFGLETE